MTVCCMELTRAQFAFDLYLMSMKRCTAGKLCRFALKSVPLKNENEFPVAHTCFNRIDLPKYTSKEQLEKKLQYVVKAEISGFEIE